MLVGIIGRIKKYAKKSGRDNNIDMYKMHPYILFSCNSIKKACRDASCSLATPQAKFLKLSN